MIRTTHILLIRHGQTDANAAGQLQGHQPTPLNVVGIRQANLLAARLAGYSPALEAIISSDLPRACETAAPIASACGLQLVLHPAWRERGFGLLEGKPVGDKSMWQVAGGETDLPGVEPSADFRKRIIQTLTALPKTNLDKQVIAVVTHGGPIRVVIQALVDGLLPIARGDQQLEVPTIPNCAILHLVARHYSDGLKWKVQGMNDVAHLQE